MHPSSLLVPSAVLLLCAAAPAQVVDGPGAPERSDFPVPVVEPQSDAAAAALVPERRVPRPEELEQLDVPERDLHDAPAAVRTALAASAGELCFDAVGGVEWVRGTAYKASFDGDAATIVPFFGSDAPRNYPLSLRAQASLGGAPLAGARGSVARSGSLVEIDRGGFVEQYRLAAESLEQSFVFRELPDASAGDLVVRIAVDSELAGLDLGETLRFENELGRVDYGQAFAIDADGRRLALDSRLADGAIELVVPADFVSSAARPLVIDPLVTFFTIGSSGIDDIQSDVSYDATTDKWCAVWESAWSATDHDMYARLVTGAGTASTTLTIDFTSESWLTGKIANSNRADAFLVAATVVPPGGVPAIRGRMVLAGNDTTGAPFPITPVDGVARNSPDVGSDPFPFTPSFFCVVWQRNAGGGNFDIEARLVDVDGSLFGGVIPLESSPEWHERPSISSSIGVGLGGRVAWTVVWQRRLPDATHDIYGAQLGWSGGVITPKFPISTASQDDIDPAVSTILNQDTAGPTGDRPYLVVFQRRLASDSDLLGVVMRGSSVLQAVNLSTDHETPWYPRDQSAPAVDSDGAQFLVAYVERMGPLDFDANLWVSDYYWSGTSLVPCTIHEPLAGSGQPETEVEVHSKASSAGTRGRYAATWTYLSGNNGKDTQFGLWDACTGGRVRSLCAGDGSAGPCPCGNVGGPGRGCPNSVNAAGALLSWTGRASVSDDTLALQASGMPATASCLFFQSATLSPGGFGQAFGDGLRCAIGPSIRLGLFSSSGGAASYPSLGFPRISLQGQIPAVGATLYYQAWYRDPALFCTATTFNVTNAVEVIWAP